MKTQRRKTSRPILPSTKERSFSRRIGRRARFQLPQNPANAYDAVATPPERQLLQDYLQGGPKAAAIMQRFQRSEKVMAALAPAGAAAILRDSCMPDAMLHMGVAGTSVLPVAYVSHPDYEWLHRLAKVGQGRFHLDLEGKFSTGPVPVSNVVAQIKGSEQPNQQVIIGAHLDSWDLAEGAVDNGTGAVAVIEAARLLRSLGWTPRRTLTFVLFYGDPRFKLKHYLMYTIVSARTRFPANCYSILPMAVRVT